MTLAAPTLGVYAVLFAAVPTAAWLWFRPAPYGRHGASGWGPPVPGRLGWLVMECPTLLVFLPLAARDPHVPLIALWLLHYGYRTLIYPLRLPSVRPMPLAVVASGLVFQLVNSANNGLAVAGSTQAGASLWVGASIFLVGTAIHHHGDQVLMGLRQPGETGYHVPNAGLYRWVTNVAYLGELITWLGWWVASGSAAGLAMFVFTAANLVPRARSNHRWYLDRFSAYPPDRKILLPGIW